MGDHSDLEDGNESDYSDADRYDSPSESGDSEYNPEQNHFNSLVKKRRILFEKISLLILYNSGSLDPDEFYGRLKKIRKENEDETFEEYTNKEVDAKEEELSDLVGEYIAKMVEPGSISLDQLSILNKTKSVFYSMSEEYLNNGTEPNSDDPIVSESLDESILQLLGKEEKRIKGIAKSKLGIKVPKKTNGSVWNKQYREFYNKMIKYLPGYYRKMNVTSIGETYEHYDREFNKFIMEQQLIDLKKEHKTLPIKLDTKSAEYAKQKQDLRSILTKMNVAELIDCAVSSGAKVPTMETTNGRLSGKTKKQYTVFIKDPKYATLTPMELGLWKSKLKTYQQYDKFYIKKKFKRVPGIFDKTNKGSIETFESANKLKDPEVIQKIKEAREFVLKDSEGKNGFITKPLRDQSIARLNKAFSLTGSPGLMINLENDIWNLNKDYFNALSIYTNKINDIIFIFEEYPHFKDLLVSGKINTEQFAIFEKEIAFQIFLRTAPVSNRRNVIKTIKNKFTVNPFKKGGLKIITTIVAKRIELFIYDCSTTKLEYNKNVNSFLKVMDSPKNQTGILTGQLTFKQILDLSEPVKVKATDYSKLTNQEIASLIGQEKQLLHGVTEYRAKKKINDKIDNLKRILQKNWDEDESKGSEIIKRMGGVILEKNKPSYQLYYPLITKLLINEVIQAYKRRLMIYEAGLDYSNGNKLNEILEMLDLNDLLAKDPKLQYKLIVDFNVLMPNVDFSHYNAFYYNKSIVDISFYVEVPPGQLVINFPKEYYPDRNKSIISFYGQDLFELLYSTEDPVKFYPLHSVRLLNKWINQPPPESREIRTLKILYDPYTGGYGDAAVNGYLFDVHKLDKDFTTGLPLYDIVPVSSIDPRTNSLTFKKEKVEKTGRFNFIKLPVQTNKQGVFNYKWIEVPLAQTKMYLTNFDSCSRFKTKGECHGPGMGNSTCEFNNTEGVCKANYSKSWTNGASRNVDRANGTQGLLTNFGKRLKFGKSK